MRVPGIVQGYTKRDGNFWICIAWNQETMHGKLAQTFIFYQRAVSTRQHAQWNDRGRPFQLRNLGTIVPCPDLLLRVDGGVATTALQSNVQAGMSNFGSWK